MAIRNNIRGLRARRSESQPTELFAEAGWQPQWCEGTDVGSVELILCESHGNSDIHGVCCPQNMRHHQHEQIYSLFYLRQGLDLTGFSVLKSVRQSDSTQKLQLGATEIGSKRAVICMDSLKWMIQSENDGLKDGLFVGSVLTSLPDVSELQFPKTSEEEKIEKYKEWFIHTAAMILDRLRPCLVFFRSLIFPHGFTRVPVGNFAIFYQSDVRKCNKDGYVEEWVDKAALCYEASKRFSARMSHGGEL
eukprot:763159-Hanusia_phi.AAC.12